MSRPLGNKGRAGRPWDRLRRQVIAEETHCWRCGHPVDKRLPGTHPLGPTAGHIIAVTNGGAPEDRTNLRLEHKICGQRAGNRRDGQADRAPRTRRW